MLLITRRIGIELVKRKKSAEVAFGFGLLQELQAHGSVLGSHLLNDLHPLGPYPMPL